MLQYERLSRHAVSILSGESGLTISDPKTHHYALVERLVDPDFGPLPWFKFQMWSTDTGSREALGYAASFFAAYRVADLVMGVLA